MKCIKSNDGTIRVILALSVFVAAALQPSVAAAQACPDPAMDEKYAELDEGLKQLFGREAESGAARDGGCYRHYENGSIYWSPESGAHEVHGDIRAKWASLGWEWGLGYPLTDMTATPDGIGGFNHFQRGSIYWTPETGANDVYGAIREKWAELGWEQGLGYPLTGEQGSPDGIGRFNHFQRGSIYWTQDTGAHEVHGGIRNKWVSLGSEQSFLGYPLTDETAAPDGIGRFNQFQGGSIYWTLNTGAHEVHGAIRHKWAELGWETGLVIQRPTKPRSRSVMAASVGSSADRYTGHPEPDRRWRSMETLGQVLPQLRYAHAHRLAAARIPRPAASS